MSEELETQIEETPIEEVLETIDDGEPQEEQAEQPQPQQEEEASWVKELRKKHKELTRRNRELEEQLKSHAPAAKPVLGKKPTLEECDYDTVRYESELVGWYETKRKVDEEAQKAESAAKKQQEEWNGKLQSYATRKTELQASDFEESESLVQELFSVTQQGMILQGCDNPAHVVYELGKNLKKASELSAITDPVKYAFAIAKYEINLKGAATMKNKAPPPEKRVSSSGSLSSAVDSTLDRLRAEAEKTGDYTKVMQYKNAKKVKK